MRAQKPRRLSSIGYLKNEINFFGLFINIYSIAVSENPRITDSRIEGLWQVRDSSIREK
jgi:hypothetical protein